MRDAKRMGGSSRRLTLVIMALVLGACRAGLPTTGAPLQTARITSTPLPTTASTFTSTSADLGPIAATIRSSFRFGGDPLDPTMGLTWNFGLVNRTCG